MCQLRSQEPLCPPDVDSGREAQILELRRDPEARNTPTHTSSAWLPPYTSFDGPSKACILVGALASIRGCTWTWE